MTMTKCTLGQGKQLCTLSSKGGRRGEGGHRQGKRHTQKLWQHNRSLAQDAIKQINRRRRRRRSSRMPRIWHRSTKGRSNREFFPRATNVPIPLETL